MRSIAGFIIRSSAFIQKELAEIIRQTRLILALVLGPFLILLLFGLGYRNEARVLRTVFVVPPTNITAEAQIKEYVASLGAQLDFRGITADREAALRDLNRGAVDVVAVIPDRIEEKIRDSEQPVVQLFHREIDPIQANYVSYFAQIYVDELNRRILRSIATQGQAEAADVQGDLKNAKAGARAMRIAFEANDGKAAQRHRGETRRSMDAVSLGVGASLGVLQGVEQTMNTTGSPQSDSPVSEILSTMDSITQSDSELEQSDPDQTDFAEEAKTAARMETELEQLDQQLADFRQIDSTVLISPFKAEALNVGDIKVNSSDFFAPGVIILLLQHMAITFAALSIVRERLSGAMELFRVSPISAFETLLGKYISYLLLGAALAAAISALVVLVLRVPMLGMWGNYALVLFAVLFASLGIGFFISLVSETTSQAVQYGMLILLFSIFFSGFFLDLRLMTPNLRWLSWGIPTTYGMRMLQEIMFRGGAIQLPLMLGLLGMGLGFFLLSWLILRHQMRLH